MRYVGRNAKIDERLNVVAIRDNDAVSEAKFFSKDVVDEIRVGMAWTVEHLVPAVWKVQLACKVRSGVQETAMRTSHNKPFKEGFMNSPIDSAYRNCEV